jgi:spoIIIJ-associated protein
MESLEISAKTVEEATKRALEKLGLTPDQVEVSVVKEGRAGVFGLGAEEAVVRVTPKAQAVPEAVEKSGNIEEAPLADTAKDALQKLVDLMGINGTVEVQDQAELPSEDEEGNTAPAVALNINGNDLGILIGRRGQTLSCLQYVLRLVVGHQTKNWTPIVVDVEAYKQRRYQALQVLARNMAEQVKAKGTPFTLEPMPAYERRIIHLTLANNPDVVTQSIGEGESRKIVILPKDKGL